MSTKSHTHTRVLTAEGWNRQQARLRGSTQSRPSQSSDNAPAAAKNVKEAPKTAKGKKA